MIAQRERARQAEESLDPSPVDKSFPKLWEEACAGPGDRGLRLYSRLILGT